MNIAAGRLAVTADLRLEVGGTEATLKASGQHLVLRSAAPQSLWAELNHAALRQSVGTIHGPRAVGRAADLLRDSGLHLDIEGPAGVLVHLGDGAHSRWGRMVTGSGAVQVSSLRPLIPLVSSMLLHSQWARRSVAVVGAAGAAAAITSVARRLRQPGR
jgi:hypothetical protein